MESTERCLNRILPRSQERVIEAFEPLIRSGASNTSEKSTSNEKTRHPRNRNRRNNDGKSLAKKNACRRGLPHLRPQSHRRDVQTDEAGLLRTGRQGPHRRRILRVVGRSPNYLHLNGHVCENEQDIDVSAARSWVNRARSIAAGRLPKRATASAGISA